MASPYSRQRGSSTSQSEPLLKLYFGARAAFIFSKP